MLRILLGLAVLINGAPQTLLAQERAPSSEGATLQPGDVLLVAIWREEDLSGEFTVDASGTVTLPLLGEKKVSGIPMDRLRDMLIEDYRVQLRNPSIDVTPLRRIDVLGEVREPGVYKIDPTVSLAGAVALAGGATSAGDLNHLTVVRNGGVRERIPSGTSLNTAQVRSGDQIFVGRRNWFERNSTFVVSALLSITGIVISVIR
jgi:polysaccharide export outer membrane protein